MLKEIKDNPGLFKDTDTGAIVTKPQTDKNSIKIRNLEKRVNKLENELTELKNKIINDKS